MQLYRPKGKWLCRKQGENQSINRVWQSAEPGKKAAPSPDHLPDFFCIVGTGLPIAFIRPDKAPIMFGLFKRLVRGQAAAAFDGEAIGRRGPMPAFPIQVALGLATLLSIGSAHAATYSLPAALDSGVFSSCSPTTYSCTADIDFGNDNSVVINLTQSMTLTVAGNFVAKNNLQINENGFAFNLVVSGDVSFNNNATFGGNITAGGNVDIKNSGTVTGNLTSINGNINVGQNGTIVGSISALNGNVSLGNGTIFTGTCTGTGCPASAAPNHVEFIHNGSALTCTPKAVTVLGCTTSASCYNVGANQASGSFAISPTAIPGATWCSDSTCTMPLTSPAAVTNGTVIYLKDTNVRTDRMAGTSSATGNAVIQCINTSTSAFNATTACDVAVAASGFLVSLPNHASCTSPTLAVQAVQASNNAANCVPMFNSQTRTETIRFAYVNPASGTLAPAVAGTTISTGGASVSLAFDSTGTAHPAFVYQDVGSLSITVTDPALPMTGSASAVVAPNGFSFSGIPAAPLTAGAPFNVTVTAMNACATPAATPNFGKESPPATATLASSNPQPAPGNAAAISQSLAGFAGGAASTDLTWNEVGAFDLTAATSNYLGSPLGATGTQPAVGRFKPAYFDTVVTPKCSGAFTYAGLSGAVSLAGQPFTVVVKAKRQGGDATDATNTANYAGATWARAVTLSDAGAGTGTLANTVLANTDFASGIGSRTDVTYSFPGKLTAPYTLAIRATDADTAPVSSSGHAEGSTAMRSGRLRLANAFGSEKAALAMSLQAEYWSGQSWVLSSADGCTSLLANAFALSGPLAANTASSPVTLAGGAGTLTLAKPNPVATGSVDVAVDLGSGGGDQSCLPSHGGAAAGQPWLRSQNGNCAATYDRDPSARATFGVYAPETRKSIHVRELY